MSKFDRQHLNILNSFEQNKTTMKKFKIVQKLESFEKYMRVIKRFICFIIRVLSSDFFKDIYKIDSEINDLFKRLQEILLNIETSDEYDVLDIFTRRNNDLRNDLLRKHYNSQVDTNE